MSKGTKLDPTNQETQRLNTSLLRKKKDKFIPFKCLDFDFKITLSLNTSPDNLITFFTLYYTLKIIELIVQHTNNTPKKPRTLAS
jgi:hypothetical protein